MCLSNAGLDEEEDGMEVCGKEAWPLVTNLGAMVPRPFCSNSLLVPVYLQRLELLHSLEIGVLFSPQLKGRSDLGEETQRCPRLLDCSDIKAPYLRKCILEPLSRSSALCFTSRTSFGRCVFRGLNRMMICPIKCLASSQT